MLFENGLFLRLSCFVTLSCLSAIFLLNLSKVSSKLMVDFSFLPVSSFIKFFLNLSKLNNLRCPTMSDYR